MSGRTRLWLDYDDSLLTNYSWVASILLASKNVHLLRGELLSRQHFPLREGSVTVHVHPHESALDLGRGGNTSQRTKQQSYSTISIWQNQQWTIICSIGCSNLMGRAHSSLAYLRSLTSLDLLWEEDNRIFWKKWKKLTSYNRKAISKGYIFVQLAFECTEDKDFVTIQSRWYYTPG